MKNGYIPPEDVNSPKRHWVLVDVLVAGDQHETAVAIGRWDGKPRLALRWNGGGDNRIGNPQSRGLPTWFIVDPEYSAAILNSAKLKPAKLDLAKTFLGV